MNENLAPNPFSLEPITVRNGDYLIPGSPYKDLPTKIGETDVTVTQWINLLESKPGTVSVDFRLPSIDCNTYEGSIYKDPALELITSMEPDFWSSGDTAEKRAELPLRLPQNFCGMSLSLDDKIALERGEVLKNRQFSTIRSCAYVATLRTSNWTPDITRDDELDIEIEALKDHYFLLDTEQLPSSGASAVLHRGFAPDANPTGIYEFTETKKLLSLDHDHLGVAKTLEALVDRQSGNTVIRQALAEHLAEFNRKGQAPILSPENYLIGAKSLGYIGVISMRGGGVIIDDLPKRIGEGIVKVHLEPELDRGREIEWLVD